MTGSSGTGVAAGEGDLEAGGAAGTALGFACSCSAAGVGLASGGGEGSTGGGKGWDAGVVGACAAAGGSAGASASRGLQPTGTRKIAANAAAMATVAT